MMTSSGQPIPQPPSNQHQPAAPPSHTTQHPNPSGTLVYTGRTTVVDTIYKGTFSLSYVHYHGTSSLSLSFFLLFR